MEKKNIGCDKCCSWFHLRCSEFKDCSYDEASTKDFVCDMCNCEWIYLRIFLYNLELIIKGILNYIILYVIGKFNHTCTYNTQNL